MKLNSLAPAIGSKTKKIRVGRGIGSGIGKTCGKGHKGQKARTGGYRKTGFEGGQMPLQRRLPKMGFISRKALSTAELRLSELAAHPADIEVTVESLKAMNLVSKGVVVVKIFGEGVLEKALTVKQIKVSKSARAAIEKAGGRVEV